MATPQQSDFDQFRNASDKAFAEMQARADREMEMFLEKYGGDSVLTGAPGATLAQSSLGAPPQAAAPPQAQAPPQKREAPSVKESGGARPATGSGLYNSVSGLDLDSINKNRMVDSVDDLKDDFGKLSQKLREEGRAAAREAARGTSDIIKNSANNLGQRAKQEAARLREAARKAREEERNLKSLRGRAAEEARQAKQRMAQAASEAKDDLMDDLKNFASDQFSSFKGKAEDAFESGQDSLKREFNDFTTGQDS